MFHWTYTSYIQNWDAVFELAFRRFNLRLFCKATLDWKGQKHHHPRHQYSEMKQWCTPHFLYNSFYRFSLFYAL